MERSPSTTAPDAEARARSAKVRKALEQMWEANRGTIAERLSALRAAHQQLAAGSLAGDTRAHAAGAAHKLAGVLGTFGFPRGSELALQAQLLLEQDGVIPASEIERLRAIVDELTLIAAAKSLPTPEG